MPVREAIQLALAAWAVVGGLGEEPPEQLTRDELRHVAWWVSGDEDFVDFAERASWCESRWRPMAKNPSSSASGLMQVIRSTWTASRSTASESLGSFATHRFDPVENLRVAWLLYQRNGTRDWAASEGCWR